MPLITQVLIGISSELSRRFWLWLPLSAGAVVGSILFIRSERGRRLWDRVTLNAPVVKDVNRSLLIGRACCMLGIMIASGVPLLESLRLTKSAIKNSLYRRLFAKLEDDVLNGRGLAAAMLESGFIPGAAAEMMVTAEQTGTLGMVTEMIGTHFEEEGAAKLKEVVSILEPTLTILMGAIVSIVVSSVMLPLFDLSSAAK